MFTNKDKGALRPEVFTLQSYIKQEKDIEALTNEEKILASGATNVFWLTLKEHFENEIEKLEQINDTAMANNMSMEEIGRNTIVISLVKGVLKRIVGVVRDAKEADDERIKQQLTTEGASQ